MEVPPYHSKSITSAAQVQFYVCNGKRKRSQSQRFTYLSGTSHTHILPAVIAGVCHVLKCSGFNCSKCSIWMRKTYCTPLTTNYLVKNTSDNAAFILTWKDIWLCDFAQAGCLQVTPFCILVCVVCWRVSPANRHAPVNHSTFKMLKQLMECQSVRLTLPLK